MSVLLFPFHQYFTSFYSVGVYVFRTAKVLSSVLDNGLIRVLHVFVLFTSLAVLFVMYFLLIRTLYVYIYIEFFSLEMGVNDRS